MDTLLLAFKITDVTQLTPDKLNIVLTEQDVSKALVAIANVLNSVKKDIIVLRFINELLKKLQPDELITLVVQLQIFRIDVCYEAIVAYQNYINKFKVLFLGNVMFNSLYLAFTLLYMQATYQLLECNLASFVFQVRSTIDYMSRQSSYQMQDWEELVQLFMKSFSVFPDHVVDLCNIVYELVSSNKISSETRQHLSSILSYIIAVSQTNERQIYCNFNKVWQLGDIQSQEFVKTLYKVRNHELTPLSQYAKSEEVIGFSVQYENMELFKTDSLDIDFLLTCINETSTTFFLQGLEIFRFVQSLLQQNQLHRYISTLFKFGAEPQRLAEILLTHIQDHERVLKDNLPKFRIISRDTSQIQLKSVFFNFIYAAAEQNLIDVDIFESYLEKVAFDENAPELLLIGLKTAVRFEQSQLFEKLGQYFASLPIEAQYQVLCVSIQQDSPIFDDLILQMPSYDDLSPAASQYLAVLLRRKFELKFVLNYLKAKTLNLNIVNEVVGQLFNQDFEVFRMYQDVAVRLQRLPPAQLANQQSQLSQILQHFAVANLVSKLLGNHKTVEFEHEIETPVLALIKNIESEENKVLREFLTALVQKTEFKNHKTLLKRVRIQEQVEYLIVEFVRYLTPRYPDNQEFFKHACAKLKIADFE